MVIVLWCLCAPFGWAAHKGHAKAATAPASKSEAKSAHPGKNKSKATDEDAAPRGKKKGKAAQGDAPKADEPAAHGKRTKTKAQESDKAAPVAAPRCKKGRAKCKANREDAPAPAARSARGSRDEASNDESQLLVRRGRKGRHAAQDADAPAAAPARCRRGRHGRLMACKVSASVSLRDLFQPTPLRGSYESLVRQNVKTEDDGLERILDDKDLNDRIARGVLVPVPVTGALAINPGLPENRRYCRPWTAQFLSDLAKDHEAEFHKSLLVSSAVRTVAFQKQLMRSNGNAASAEGDVASPHLTGATIDIAKQGMSRRELEWMRDHLLPIQQAGRIDVEEEFRQACFHITVYKLYTGQDSNDNTGDHPGAIPARLAPDTALPALPAIPQRQNSTLPDLRNPAL